jgi:hypothetical protein
MGARGVQAPAFEEAGAAAAATAAFAGSGSSSGICWQQQRGS